MKSFCLVLLSKKLVRQTIEINKPPPRYELQNIGSDWSNKMSYEAFHWIGEPISLHLKISYLLRVIKYDFSQWPKMLYHTKVYEISTYIHSINELLPHLSWSDLYFQLFTEHFIFRNCSWIFTGLKTKAHTSGLGYYMMPFGQ